MENQFEILITSPTTSSSSWESVEQISEGGSSTWEVIEGNEDLMNGFENENNSPIGNLVMCARHVVQTTLDTFLASPRLLVLPTPSIIRSSRLQEIDDYRFYPSILSNDMIHSLHATLHRMSNEVSKSCIYTSKSISTQTQMSSVQVRNQCSEISKATSNKVRSLPTNNPSSRRQAVSSIIVESN